MKTVINIVLDCLRYRFDIRFATAVSMGPINFDDAKKS